MTNKLRDFIVKYRFLLIGFFSIFFLGGLALFFVVAFQQKNYTVRKEALKAVFLTPATIYLPQEPLSRGQIEFSREQKKQWDQADFEQWYTQPSTEDIEVLHQKNQQTIEALLKEVP